MVLRIGIDFDNTIVCYDAVFHRVALEQGLIPPEFPANKNAIRDYLRAAGLENRWTAMQGYVYGARMSEAAPFPGALSFIGRLLQARLPVFIISHKTRHPYQGPPYDLHKAAQDWLQQYGFFNPAGLALSRDRVFFELTKQAKLERIAAQGCSHFIDDLPELLGEPGFPAGVVPLLFDPGNEHADRALFRRFLSWHHCSQELLAA